MIFLLPISMAIAAPSDAIATMGPDDHILSADKAWRAYPGGWTPLPADVVRAKTAMRAWLDASELSAADRGKWDNERLRAVREKIDSYALQYLGVRYERGARTYTYAASGSRGILIHGGIANGVWTTGPHAFDRELVIADGGTHFFDALVDTDTGSVVWFSVHGLA